MSRRYSSRSVAAAIAVAPITGRSRSLAPAQPQQSCGASNDLPIPWQRPDQRPPPPAQFYPYGGEAFLLKP
jgi:hypothetical protein